MAVESLAKASRWAVCFFSVFLFSLIVLTALPAHGADGALGRASAGALVEESSAGVDSKSAKAIVVFPDPSLEAAIRAAISKPTGDILDTDLVGVGFTSLTANSSNISDLTGLGYCTDLIGLSLYMNQIVDIGPIASLTNLQTLTLFLNQVVDLSPLSSLSTLLQLNIASNQITDITDLAGLTNLTSLDIYSNAITDISTLANLTSLNTLHMSYISTSTLAPVSGLANLSELWADSNGITDITDLAGLTNLTNLHMFNNQISNISPLSGLTGLTELWIQMNQITDITDFAVLTNLTTLNVSNNQIINVTPLASITGMINLTISSNQISDIVPLSSMTSITDMSMANNQIINIIPLAGMTGMKNLYAYSNQIVDMSPLSGMTSLAFLNLSENQISNVSTLAGKTSLTDLYLNNNQISNISTLTGLTGLDTLNLSSNTITNISVLSGMTSLTFLDMSSNQIIDLSSLSGLTGMTNLNLEENQISNISSLSGMTSMMTLFLSMNQISDVTSLSGMTGVDLLLLYSNKIRDISALSSMTSLASVVLNANFISDISPLVSNAGIDSGDDVDITNNPLSQTALCTDIDTLEARGVIVNYTGACGEDADGDGLSDDYEAIIGTNPNVADTDGDGLDDGDEINTHFTDPTLADTDGDTVNDGDEISGGSDPLNASDYVIVFADANLEAAVRTAISVPEGSIFNADVVGVGFTSLTANSSGISDLSGLQYCTDLTSLTLSTNLITDIGPLSGLTSLTFLNIPNNQISDLSPLSGLTSMTDLYLHGNQISDIGPISGLTSMTNLWLSSNQLTGISAVSGMTALTTFSIEVNQVADISPLSGFTSLSTLQMSGNQISNISAVSGMTSLTVLNFTDNQVVDISPVSGLPSLTHLYARNNLISNISAVSSVTTLTVLDVSYNQLSDISGVSTLASLDYLMLDVNPLSDLSPVSGLTSLLGLSLFSTGISDISDLNGLTSLTSLNLRYNQITDISALSGLTEMESLQLSGNQIISISSLSGMTSMMFIEIISNKISDISVFAGMTALVSVDLSGNRIASISALTLSEGMDTGDTVDLSWNPLSQTALCTDIDTLEGQGVSVTFTSSGACGVDADGDNLSDDYEIWLGTNPDLKDTDSDGLDDDVEVITHYTNPLVADTDNDGLDDGEEVNTYFTDPNDADSDDDGVNDGDEIAGGSDPLDGAEWVVVFPDANLDAAVRTAISQPTGNIYNYGLTGVGFTSLTANSSSISDLTGIEYCTDLTILSLRGNQIADISPVSGLTALTYLDLSYNQITVISPISGLTSLIYLPLSTNQISDISALSGLTALEWLYLENNQISNISALSGLTAMRSLRLYSNQISDISALSGLTALTDLRLYSNQISDISPVSGLTALTRLYLYSNQISDISALSGLTALTDLDLDTNRISDISPLVSNAGIDSGDSLDLRYNPLSQTALCGDISTLEGRSVPVTYTGACGEDADGDGLSDDYETWLGTDPDSAHSDGDSLDDGVEVLTHYTDPLDADTDGDTVNDDVEVSGGSDPLNAAEYVVVFPDANLDAAVRTAISKPTGFIFNYDVLGVGFTSLGAGFLNISDLTGLGYCTDLTSLSIQDNQLSDISPLSGLTALTTLELYRNQLSDISPVSGLTALTTLKLSYNQISDISPLSSLTALTTLNLSYNFQITDISTLSGLNDLTFLSLQTNQISDISPLSGLTALTYLYLGYNQISDISPVNGLTTLTYLSVFSNQLSDISPVSGLTGLTQLNLASNQFISDISTISGLNNLTYLSLHSNQISDISPVSGLTALTELYLNSNQISDISPVSGLTALTRLWLYSNQISDISPLSGLTALTWLELSSNQISDISPVGGLTALTRLDLDTNRIADISPLVSNAGIDSGDYLEMVYNPLSQVALCTDIPTLQGRGTSVTYTGACGVDTDSDNLSDDYETWLGTDPGLADTDSDGLDDDVEVITHYTNPSDPDSDLDGWKDGEEVVAGTDPNDALDYPVLPVPLITTDGGNGAGVDYDTTQAALTLDGTCHATTNEIRVNGDTTGVTYTPGDTTWSYSGTLILGDNLFTVIAYDIGANPSQSATITVALVTAPTAAFSGTPTSGYKSLDVQFSDESLAGTAPITSWLWDFGDTNSSTEQDPAHIYDAAGVYDVSLTVTSGHGTDTLTEVAYIDVLDTTAPTAAFSGTPTSGYKSLDVQFSDESLPGTAAITSWLWDFGDTNSSSQQNPAHIYDTAGVYDVSLTVTSAHGTDSLTKAAYIDVSDTTAPAAAFSGTPTSGYKALDVQFADESLPGTTAITTWLWDFGDTNTSTEQHPAHIYDMAGVYDVSLTVTSAHGTDTLTKVAYIDVSDTTAPAAAFSGIPTSGYKPLDVQFTDESAPGTAAITTWLWDFGDTNTSTEQHPAHIYDMAGVYDVSLTVTSAHGTDTLTKVAYIDVSDTTAPTAAFSATPTSGNKPLDVQFTDESLPGTAAITSWLWDFGDTNTSTEQHPAHTYDTAGAYDVSLTVTTAHGTDTLTEAAYIDVSDMIAPTAACSATPTLGIVPLSVQCTDESLPGTAAITSWLWDFGDSNTSSEQNPSHTYDTAGAYDLSLTVTTAHGTDTVTKIGYFNVFDSADDSDDDGMLDSWETTQFGNLSHDGSADGDADGLTDLEEFQNNTDPNDADTDGDGILDGGEIDNGLDPLDPDDAGLDQDGDGLISTDEVSRFGSDPFNPDTDGDGMPDGFEALYAFDPADSSDAAVDSDSDGYTNLKEYHMRSDPSDASDPSQSFFVAAGGEPMSGEGTAGNPWTSIAYAQQQLIATEQSPATLLLLDGVHSENVALDSWITLAGANPGSAIIEGDGSQEGAVVIGGHSSGLRNLEVRQAPSDAGSIVLVEMPDIIMTLDNVTLRGNDARLSVGLRTTGETPADSLVTGCTFTTLSNAIEIGGGIPTIRKCYFTDLSGNGIVLEERSGAAGQENGIGDVNDPNTGYNTFDSANIGGYAVVNHRASNILMQNNDWGVANPLDVIFDVSGAKGSTFEPPLESGAGLLPGTLICSVWDSKSLAPILDAAVGAGTLTVTENTEGIYTFASLPSGSYTVDVSAGAYTGQQKDVTLADGEILPVLFPLEPSIQPPQDSDGDGLSNSFEIEMGTDPYDVDTDDDGINDDVEIAYGSDPNVPNLIHTTDVNGDYAVNAVDVQLVINAALGLDIGGMNGDIDRNGAINATDVQLVINAALGIGLK